MGMVEGAGRREDGGRKLEGKNTGEGAGGVYIKVEGGGKRGNAGFKESGGERGA